MSERCWKLSSEHLFLLHRIHVFLKLFVKFWSVKPGIHLKLRQWRPWTIAKMAFLGECINCIAQMLDVWSVYLLLAKHGHIPRNMSGKCTIRAACGTGYCKYSWHFPHELFFFPFLMATSCRCVMTGLVNEEECRAKVMALQHLGVTIVEDDRHTPYLVGGVGFSNHSRHIIRSIQIVLYLASITNNNCPWSFI